MRTLRGSVERLEQIYRGLKPVSIPLNSGLRSYAAFRDMHLEELGLNPFEFRASFLPELIDEESLLHMSQSL